MTAGQSFVNIPQRLQQFLGAEFTREAGGGFARLSRVPDTHVRHFLDYYQSLDPPDRAALAEASTTWGSHTFAGSTIDGHQVDSRDVRSIMQSNRAWVAWMNEMTHRRDRDPHWYTSVPLLRDYRALATMRRKRGEPPPTSWDRMMEEYALSIHGAKVPLLRSLMRTMFTERFHGRAIKGVGGDWTYEGALSDGLVQLSVDWGSQSAQLRYGVTIFTRSGTLHLMRGFEGALGAGHGEWDFLTEKNAEDSIALLGDLIEDIADWPARLTADQASAE